MPLCKKICQQVLAQAAVCNCNNKGFPVNSAATTLLLAAHFANCTRLTSLKHNCTERDPRNQHEREREFSCVAGKRCIASFECVDKRPSLASRLSLLSRREDSPGEKKTLTRKKRRDFPIDKYWLNASAGRPIPSLRSVVVGRELRFGVRSSVSLDQFDISKRHLLSPLCKDKVSLSIGTTLPLCRKTVALSTNTALLSFCCTRYPHALSIVLALLALGRGLVTSDLVSVR